MKELRSERGWTQEELGTLVGVSRQTIISIEQGRYNPSIMLAFRIARAFGKAIEEVFLCAAEVATADDPTDWQKPGPDSDASGNLSHTTDTPSKGGDASV